jgi:hypothetical protein
MKLKIVNRFHEQGDILEIALAGREDYVEIRVSPEGNAPGYWTIGAVSVDSDGRLHFRKAKFDEVDQDKADEFFVFKGGEIAP